MADADGDGGGDGELGNRRSQRTRRPSAKLLVQSAGGSSKVAAATPGRSGAAAGAASPNGVAAEAEEEEREGEQGRSGDDDDDDDDFVEAPAAAARRLAKEAAAAAAAAAAAPAADGGTVMGEAAGGAGGKAAKAQPVFDFPRPAGQPDSRHYELDHNEEVAADGLALLLRTMTNKELVQVRGGLGWLVAWLLGCTQRRVLQASSCSGWGKWWCGCIHTTSSTWLVQKLGRGGEERRGEGRTVERWGGAWPEGPKPTACGGGGAPGTQTLLSLVGLQ